MQKTRFSQKKLSNLELWSLLTTYRKLPYVIGLFKEPIIGSLKSKMAEIGHLENQHDVIFSAEGDPIWIKFRFGDWCRMTRRLRWCGRNRNQLQNSNMSDFRRIQWHVIPESRITLQGAATWWIHCHDSRATCHIAECKNSIRHIINRFSSYYIFCF